MDSIDKHFQTTVEKATSEKSITPYISPIEDASYLESLDSSHITIKNPEQSFARPLTPEGFLYEYAQRQQGIISRITALNTYITNHRLLTPADLTQEDKINLHAFMSELNSFLASSFLVAHGAKDMITQLAENLGKKYQDSPEVYDYLLVPSVLPISLYKYLRQAEYSTGENTRYADEFCCGNHELARRTLPSSFSPEVIAKIKEKEETNRLHKKYLMLEHPDIALLDKMLVIDNFLELWIWKESFFMSTLWHTYNLLSEAIDPTEQVHKDHYIFDISYLITHI